MVAPVLFVKDVERYKLSLINVPPFVAVPLYKAVRATLKVPLTVSVPPAIAIPLIGEFPFNAPDALIVMEPDE